MITLAPTFRFLLIATPPLNITEPSFSYVESVVELNVVVPVAAPILNVVAAPAKFNVVAVELYKFCVDCVPTTVGLPIVSVPLLAPTFSEVAAWNALTVVAFALNTFCVDCDPTTVGLFSTNVPDVAPIVFNVPAPNALTVVAVSFNKLNDVASVLTPPTGPPLINALPRTVKPDCTSTFVPTCTLYVVIKLPRRMFAYVLAATLP